ncbi:MAG: hypothetical protein KIT84_35640 [Labilithrix sp.]|nr:hypothetical protein [Labilithrix sp.]MCW5816386.1 hypothetical protein [Labilithrix sp.]
MILRSFLTGRHVGGQHNGQPDRPLPVGSAECMMARMRRIALAGACLLALLAAASPARADQSIIKTPGDHPDYRFEAEPHGLLGFGGPFRGGQTELGAGFRGTIVLVDNGFVKTINNSVGITFGADLFFARNTIFLPVAMQWNFWLTNHWSVFGEPGLGFAANRHRDAHLVNPILMLGGRYHFNDKVSLTMRIGYPSFSIGASFFL